MSKISILVYSQTGNTAKVAGWIAEGAAAVENTEVRVFNLKDDPTPDKEFINDSDAILFGAPVYSANVCWPMAQWIQTSGAYKLADKLGACFTTENSPDGGGGELAIMSMVSMLLLKGMLVYSSGGSQGRPFIHIGPALAAETLDQKVELCKIFGERVANKAQELFEK